MATSKPSKPINSKISSTKAKSGYCLSEQQSNQIIETIQNLEKLVGVLNGDVVFLDEALTEAHKQLTEQELPIHPGISTVSKKGTYGDVLTEAENRSSQMKGKWSKYRQT